MAVLTWKMASSYLLRCLWRERNDRSFEEQEDVCTHISRNKILVKVNQAQKKKKKKKKRGMNFLLEFFYHSMFIVLSWISV
jgi:hypothetical protein